MREALPLVHAEPVLEAAAPLAVDEFVRAYQQGVYRLAFSILEDADEAEDATQEALVAAVGKLETFRGQSALRTWVYAIALNVCRRRLQKRRSGQRLIDVLQSWLHLRSEAPLLPEEAALDHEVQTGVARAVRALDEKHRLPVILRYYHDLPVSEIAQVLGLSEGTVHSRLFTARERLRLRLEPMLGRSPQGHHDRF